MTNDEARMTNQTTMTNGETPKARPTPGPLLPFVIAFSSFIRHSSLVIRHSAADASGGP
jgi:hypothetical protein